ncbi:Aste57867_11189 [Aphanomyces stellatus]|uniref:Aste57867_11189 protein n=1 Tax=Aphanomyces stellatus TaxID=120398 RepID=A0A485KSF0_9STRA|nr:hypothetical protein As57867_011147 [Aphanomyces stellatus]VFT88056.1 Aste57867_11189 [Aphanomyces stellatus]
MMASKQHTSRQTAALAAWPLLLLLLHAGSVAASSKWTQLSAPLFGSPPRREGTILQVIGDHAYVYGGLSNSTFYNDTWQFDLVHRHWTQLNQSAITPGARFDHTSATHNACLYVFGGSTPTHSPNGSMPLFTQQNDLWKLDTTSGNWSPIFAPFGTRMPPPRAEATAVTTPDAMVLFGGIVLVTNSHDDALPTMNAKNATPTGFNDLWRFDFATDTWDEIVPATSSPVPTARFSHAATTVDINGVSHMIVFSGRHVVREAGWSILNDAWVIPLSSNHNEVPPYWTLLSVNPVYNRIFSGVVSIQSRLWMFGGFGFYNQNERDGLAFSDTTAAATETLPQAQLTLFFDYAPAETDAPFARFHHAMAVWKDQVLVYGGKFQQSYGDLWLRNTSYLPTEPNPFEQMGLNPVIFVLVAVFWISTVAAYLILFMLRFCLQPIHVRIVTRPLPPQGLSKAEITAFKLMPFEPKADKTNTGSSDGCSICLVDFSENEVLRQLPCGHTYHPACIDEWLVKSPACPLCKRDVGSPKSTSPANGIRLAMATHGTWSFVHINPTITFLPMFNPPPAIISPMAVLAVALSLQGSLAATTAVTSSWVKLAADGVQSNQPLPREATSLDVIGNAAYIYGGAGDAENAVFSDTWKYDLILHTWSPIATTVNPGRRFGHASTAQPNSANLYIFGGMTYDASLVTDTFDGTTQMNDLWQFDTAVGQWSLVAFSAAAHLPPARSETTVATTSTALVLFGGVSVPASSDAVDMNDVWLFHYTRHTWQHISPAGLPPSTRFSHSSATIQIGATNYMVVFGGRHLQNNGWVILGDAWMLALNEETSVYEWTPINLTPSFNRIFSGMVSINSQLWLMGGYAIQGDFRQRSGVAFSDTVFTDTSSLPSLTLLFDESSSLMYTSPSPRFDHAMAVWNGNVLVYGGKFQNCLGDFWLRNASTVPSGSSATPPFLTISYDPLVLVLSIALLVLSTCFLFLVLLFKRSRRRQSMVAPPPSPTRARGLSAEAIATFKLVAFTPSVEADPTEEICPICLVEYERGEELRQLPCHHIFHPPCIAEWLDKNMTCPMCKRDMMDPSPIPTSPTSTPSPSSPHSVAPVATSSTLAPGGATLVSSSTRIVSTASAPAPSVGGATSPPPRPPSTPPPLTARPVIPLPGSMAI